MAVEGDITKEEAKAFWSWYKILMLRWALVSTTAFLSTTVIWNFILKNYLGYKGYMATVNDTEPTFEEGDFGADWWMEEKGYKKRTWRTAFLWWFRNLCWNFISEFNPPWYSGERITRTTTFINTLEKTESNTDSEELHAYSWAERGKVHGINYVCYEIDGKIYCRYSEASAKKERQYGAGGRRFRFRRKG